MTRRDTVIDIAEAVSKGQRKAVDVVEPYLVASRNSQLNALTHLAEEHALQMAASVDQRLASGHELGPLAGVPIVVKDAICTRGIPTTAGSRILQRADGANGGYLPPYDATVVRRLKNAGAVVLGKANMDEFAMGSSNETSAYGPVKNPWDTARTPGGSSGGSAAAVAAGLCPASLGSDTGGSIRQPASLCGVVGIKPTYGRVSRYGLIAFASSLDQIGPLTSDVRSSARMLEVLAGHDENDSTSSRAPIGAYERACERDIKGLRIGLPTQYFAEGLDPQVRAVVQGVADKLEAEGCSVRPVELPFTDYGVATYYVLATAEASSNLSRFDGIRYGRRVEMPGADLARIYADSRAEGFGAEVKRRILLGTYVLSAGYYDAYYGKAQKVRTLICRDFARAFEQVDVLLTPTSPTPAFALGAKLDDPLSMYLADVYTLPASLAGIAGASVPGGTYPVAGRELPIGVQLLCPALEEERLFTAAAAVERLVGPLSSITEARSISPTRAALNT